MTTTRSQNPVVDIKPLAFRICAEIRRQGNHVNVVEKILNDVLGGVLTNVREDFDPTKEPDLFPEKSA